MLQHENMTNIYYFSVSEKTRNMKRCGIGLNPMVKTQGNHIPNIPIVP